jgi:hypothetical protein
MFEDILSYSASPLAESFSDLLEADLDDDAQLFYLRTASDIAAVAAGAGRASHPARKLLLAALTALQPDNTSSWREFYREISALVAGYPETAFGEAVGRLRRFLAENVDFADALAIEEIERTMRGHVLGA